MTPKFFKRFWMSMGVAHIILWGAATWFGWVNSNSFISHASMDALVLACFGAWQSTRVEVHQDEDADVQEAVNEVRRLERKVEGS